MTTPFSSVSEVRIGHIFCRHLFLSLSLFLLLVLFVLGRAEIAPEAFSLTSVREGN